MKRPGLFLFFLLASLLLTGSRIYTNPHKLKIINKANLEVGIQLVEVEQKRAYYFLLDQAGSADTPTEAEYAIEQGIYTMSVYYIETYDPVYGDLCEDPGSSKLYADRDLEVMIRSCAQHPYYGGEPVIRNRGENPPKIKIGTVDVKKDMRSLTGPGPD